LIILLKLILLFRRNLEKTTILHRHDVINTLLHIFSNAQHTIDICGNAKFPLNIQPIFGISQVLRSRKLNATDDYDKYLDTIIRNAKRLQRLVDRISDVTRIESQSLKLRKEKISIDDVIMDAIRDYRDEIEKCNSKLKLQYEPSNKENIIVEADRGRLTQVICNLLSNAVKFTKEGVISISTVKKGENDKDILIVSVKDTGSGIDAEIFQKLFSRFVSKSFSGTGLGLFISKSIVEAHEGKIWAENNPDGKGATFYFSLPLAVASSS
jgi:signal transduction histidine kinase